MPVSLLQTKPGPIQAASSHPERAASPYCYNCSRKGHLGYVSAGPLCSPRVEIHPCRAAWAVWVDGRAGGAQLGSVTRGECDRGAQIQPIGFTHRESCCPSLAGSDCLGEGIFIGKQLLNTAFFSLPLFFSR